MNNTLSTQPQYHQTNTIRSVHEQSCMVNNEEYVCHTNLAKFDKSNFKNLAFYRKVLREEIEAGLDISFQGNKFYEKCPELTSMLDAIAKIAGHISIYKRSRIGMSNQEIVIQYVASRFYDCMSGGMSTSEILACRVILEKIGYESDSLVYPSSEKARKNCVENDESPSPLSWHTVEDFMSETSDLLKIGDSLKLSHEPLISTFCMKSIAR